jgi:hypothetical protein
MEMYLSVNLDTHLAEARQGLHCRCDTIAHSLGDQTGRVRLKEKWELEDKAINL